MIHGTIGINGDLITKWQAINAEGAEFGEVEYRCRVEVFNGPYYIDHDNFMVTHIREQAAITLAAKVLNTYLERQKSRGK